MKTIKFFMAAVLLMAVCAVSPAQPGAKASGQTKTETIKVWGNCGMCKDRIEKAVTTEGATSASWDSKTQMLTVSFDPSKTNADALSKKIASAGHDTEKYKADEKVYNSLPGCCKYERTK
jgi:periplasmic mercuric ion binding protein